MMTAMLVGKTTRDLMVVNHKTGPIAEKALQRRYWLVVAVMQKEVYRSSLE